jgi:putative phosphoesterase
MRIGLISDTHIPWAQRDIPHQVFDSFKGVDLILHAGDIYSHDVLDRLEKIAPVLAALGDDDYPGPDLRVREKHVLEIDGQILWLIHEGPYAPISATFIPLWWQSRVSAMDKHKGKPDIIISGHQHRTIVERTNGLLHISSGSPNLLHYQKGLGTIGILEIGAGKAHVDIIQLREAEAAPQPPLLG